MNHIFFYNLFVYLNNTKDKIKKNISNLYKYNIYNTFTILFEKI